MRPNRLSEEQLRDVVLSRRMARLLRCAGPCNESRLSVIWLMLALIAMFIPILCRPNRLAAYSGNVD